MFWVLILCSISFILGSPIEDTLKQTNPPRYSEIIYYTNNNDGSGNYKYEFSSTDGTSKQEEGRLFKEEKDKWVYIGDDGKTYKTSYIADKNGYRPSGDVIPRSKDFIPEDFGSSSH